MSVVNQFGKLFNRKPATPETGATAGAADDGQDLLATCSLDGAQLHDTYQAEAMNSVQGDPDGYSPELAASDADEDLIALPVLGRATAAAHQRRLLALLGIGVAVLALIAFWVLQQADRSAQVLLLARRRRNNEPGFRTWIIAVSAESSSIHRSPKAETAAEVDRWRRHLLTNVRPGGLARAGLDPQSVLKRCPKLIYTTLTGYGLEGPDADRPGMDQAAFWARSGLAALFRPKGGDPVMLRTAFGDHVASLAIVGAVMAAVYERQHTGKGRLIDASLLRAAHYAGSSDLAIQHTRGRIASNRPRQNAPNPLINYFQTGGGRWISLLQRQGEKDWPKLARALKIEHLVNDPRFANGRARRENGPQLVPLLDEAFAAREFDDMAAALDAEEMI